MEVKRAPVLGPRVNRNVISLDPDDDLTEAFVRLVEAQEARTIESFAVGPGGTFQIYFYGPNRTGRGGTIVLDAAGVLEYTATV